MTGTFWDPHGEARAALRVIVSDPYYGVPALSNPQIVFNLVKDLLPDAPREANVLIAAAEARLAGLLVDYTRQGMDPGTAAHLVTAYFAHRTSLTPDACNWAVFAHVDSETTTRTSLQYPDPQQLALWRKYDPGTGWPFLDIGNKYKSIKGFYNTGVLRGKDQKQIAAALSDPSSRIAKAVDGAANMVIAAICQVTHQQPGSVCGAPAIQAIQARL